MISGSDGRQNEDKSIEVLSRKVDSVLELLTEIRDRVGNTNKEFYTTSDVARKYDKAEFTVREWCRLGRLEAKKLKGSGGFRISQEELARYEREGLLPIKNGYRHPRLGPRPKRKSKVPSAAHQQWIPASTLI